MDNLSQINDVNNDVLRDARLVRQIMQDYVHFVTEKCEDIQDGCPPNAKTLLFIIAVFVSVAFAVLTRK